MMLRIDSFVLALMLRFEDVCDRVPAGARFTTCLGLKADVDAGVKQGQDVTNCTSWVSVSTWLS